jgi:uncharacterized protein YbjQ (UPF0145 family)
MGAGRGDGEDARRRADESLRSIEAGGLPPAAAARLAGLREHGGSFTSDLSAAEFKLVRQAGFRPLAQVMGSCFYRLGDQYKPGTRRPGVYTPEGMAYTSIRSQGYEYDQIGRKVFQGAAFGQVFELDIHTEAWQEARRRALGRLKEEARLAGGDAVVGVRLRRGTYSWSRDLIEFVVVGTAVASERFELGDEPVLSNLSGQEFACLLATGWWPVGMLAETSVIYVMTGRNQGLATRRFAPNQELGDFTHGINYARKMVRTKMQTEAKALEAGGIVGVRIEVGRREEEHEGRKSGRQKDMIVTVHALGTAVAELAEHPAAPPVGLSLAMDVVR